MLHHPCLHTPPSICRSPILHQSLSRSHSTSLLADGLFLSQSRLSPSFTVSLFFTISSITRADCHVLLSPVCPFQACSSSYFVSAHQARSLFPFSRFPQPPSILPFGFSISSRILTAASAPHLPPPSLQLPEFISSRHTTFTSPTSQEFPPRHCPILLHSSLRGSDSEVPAIVLSTLIISSHTSAAFRHFLRSQLRTADSVSSLSNFELPSGLACSTTLLFTQVVHLIVMPGWFASLRSSFRNRGSRPTISLLPSPSHSSSGYTTLQSLLAPSAPMRQNSIDKITFQITGSFLPINCHARGNSRFSTVPLVSTSERRHPCHCWCR